MEEAIKVLVIDDSPDDRLLYRRALAKGAETRYAIAEAADGEEGLAEIARFRPDCVLLDYSLPGHNGVEVLKQLRAHHPFTPVAMLTGQGNEAVAVAAIQSGAQDYISKATITPEALQRVVGVAIEHCAMQKRIHEQRVSLETEITVRRQAEKDAEAQLERLSLLHQITRAIGERQDLDSIFQVVVRSLEDQLPVEFACLCLCDAEERALKPACVGVKNKALAEAFAATQSGSIRAEEGSLSRCLAGEFVYEPALGELESAFHRQLTACGMRSLLLAPLQVDGRTFAVLVAARARADNFSAADREFVRQLSGHVALAAHHAQLYGALQQAYDKLRETQQAVMQQERLRAVGQMASGIAHDINNALSPVALYTQSLLETEPDLSPRARAYLETTQRAVEDVSHTVARLRDFYRQREPQLTLKPVQLNELMQQVVDLTRARWSDIPMQRGIVIDIRTEPAPDLPAVMGVESELREALVNLVLNAVDALPEGGTLTLRTVPRAQPGNLRPSHVRIEVADTGAGMDEETRRRCLEPFFTTKGERGTGLGLAMVYGVAQRHAAEIDIASTPGKGTTVAMTIPARTDDAKEAQPEGAKTVLSPLRLLIVDDDPLVLRSLLTTLEFDGHVVFAASDGQSGIDTFAAATKRGEAFSAVITDLGMPHVDGRKVAAAVKAMSPATPVIMLTGWSQGFTCGDDVPEHIDGILGKPPRLRDLRAALAQLCAREPVARANVA